MYNVYAENTNRVITVRENDGLLLFHGDEEFRAPDEIFATDLTPPEPTGTMKLNQGLHIGDYESFTYLASYAAAFADFGGGRGRGGNVYLYFTDPLLEVCILKIMKFIGGVASQYIVGCYTLSYGKVINYSYNPKYLKYSGEPSAQQLDILFSISIS